MLPATNYYDEGIEQNSPSLYDAELAIKGFNRNRSAVPDSAKSDYINFNETKLNKAIHNLICYIWGQEEMLREQNDMFDIDIKKETKYSAVITGDFLTE